MKKIITNSEQETFDFACQFAKNLKGGEVIGLEGELGAGKTIFCKGLAAGLEIKQNVTSPTFVVMKIYDVKNHKTLKKLCHVDAYKITEADLIPLGIQEYLRKDDSVVIIEWVNNIEKKISKLVTKITILQKDENSREICIKK